MNIEVMNKLIVSYDPVTRVLRSYNDKFILKNKGYWKKVKKGVK